VSPPETTVLLLSNRFSLRFIALLMKGAPILQFAKIFSPYPLFPRMVPDRCAFPKIRRRIRFILALRNVLPYCGTSPSVITTGPSATAASPVAPIDKRSRFLSLGLLLVEVQKKFSSGRPPFSFFLIMSSAVDNRPGTL